MERPVTIQYPELRSEVVGAVRMLASAREGRFALADGPRGDLDYCVHILFDDTYAMFDPLAAVGVLLFENEVASLEALRDVLGPLIDELCDVEDETYLADPRWSKVETAANSAATQMWTNMLPL